MAFQKGHVKMGGSKKGQSTYTTDKKRLLKFIDEFVRKNTESVQAQYDQLEAKDKLKFLQEMFKYVVPQLRSTDLTTNGESLNTAPQYNFEFQVVEQTPEASESDLGESP